MCSVNTFKYKTFEKYAITLFIISGGLLLLGTSMAFAQTPAPTQTIPYPLVGQSYISIILGCALAGVGHSLRGYWAKYEKFIPEKFFRALGWGVGLGIIVLASGLIFTTPDTAFLSTTVNTWQDLGVVIVGAFASITTVSKLLKSFVNRRVISELKKEDEKDAAG